MSVELVVDSSTPTGFLWSSSKGPRSALIHGTPCTGTFILGQQHPIDLITPDGRDA